MAPNTGSYAKTAALGLLLGMAGVLLAAYLGNAAVADALYWPRRLLLAAAVLAGLAGAVVFVSGLVVIARANLAAGGGEDLYLRANRSRTEQGLGARPLPPAPRLGQRLRQALLPGWIRVGDCFEVRSLDEIRSTLDADGRFEGLPFMPEMLPFCGRRVRVFRVVDKIYDYGRTKKLKRLPRTVSLAGMYCDGSAHGRCEAGCYLLWKTAWLRPVRSRPAPVQAGPAAHGDDFRAQALRAGGAGGYVCQFTQLSAASTPISARDPRLDLRPLFAGNVTLRAFLVAIATRWFNRAQILRGGAAFPYMPSGRVEATPTVDYGLQAGAEIKVAPIAAIARTLNSRGKNRGLWFDRDMVKFCERRYRVQRRVGRIIEDVNGAMVPMKTPCIVLEGVVATGEYHHFVPQEDSLYWREIWLQPAAASTANDQRESAAQAGRATG